LNGEQRLVYNKENSLSEESTTNSGPRLRRTLTLWGLDPLWRDCDSAGGADVRIRVLSERGKGHVVTAILIAMVAMLFTGISYGRMARAYPSARFGVSLRGAGDSSEHSGTSLAGGMVMDYMLNPLICTIWCAQQAHDFAPALPVWGWKVFFAAIFTAAEHSGCKKHRRGSMRAWQRGWGGDRSDLCCGGALHFRPCAHGSGILYSAVL